MPKAQVPMDMPDYHKSRKGGVKRLLSNSSAVNSPPLTVRLAEPAEPVEASGEGDVAEEKWRCCCQCCHVKTGAYIIAAVELIAFCIMLFQHFSVIQDHAGYSLQSSSTAKNNTSTITTQPSYTETQIFHMISAVICIPAVLIVILMVLAIRSHRPALLLPHFFIQILVMLMCGVYCGLAVALRVWQFMAIFLLPGIGEAWFFYVMVRCYKYLKIKPVASQYTSVANRAYDTSAYR